ncbi:MAG: TMEM165/GDT1 family protein [Thermoplasmata archaeon]
MGLAELIGVATVFALIGGFELVDRSNLSLIAYSSRHDPLGSWIGASLAFVAVSAIAVSVGALLLGILGVGRLGDVRAGGGAILIAYALYLWFHLDEVEGKAPAPSSRSTILGAFLLIFLLELGDTTMILQIILVANFGVAVVFGAGASALVLVAALGCFVGSRFGSHLSRRTLDRAIVAILLIVGAGTVVYGLAPGLVGPFG